MALMVVENAESKEQAPPSGEMTETNVSSEPPPPGTEDEVPVLLSLKSLASGSGSALDEEPPPPGTEEDAPLSVQTSRNSLVVVTTSSSAIDDDHEEGEIDDDEDDERALEYEDISSEEETTIRERIAQLEAMDDELGKINQITGASSDDLGHFGNMFILREGRVLISWGRSLTSCRVRIWEYSIWFIDLELGKYSCEIFRKFSYRSGILS